MSATPPKEATPTSRPTRDELELLIRARYPIIYIISWEEGRVELRLREIAARRNKQL